MRDLLIPRLFFRVESVGVRRRELPQSNLELLMLRPQVRATLHPLIVVGEDLVVVSADGEANEADTFIAAGLESS